MHSCGARASRDHHIGQLALAAVGCSKHDCDLSGGDESKFGEVAEMTGGAHSCSVMNSELIAVHPDKSVDEIATKYESFLKSKSWTVEVKDGVCNVREGTAEAQNYDFPILVDAELNLGTQPLLPRDGRLPVGMPEVEPAAVERLKERVG